MNENQKYYSQLGQDKWVLEKLDYKKNGFFIEIGAYDGITLSNTYALEKDFGWDGICVECNPEIIPQLIQNRKCAIEERPVMHLNGRDSPFYSHAEDLTLSALAPAGYAVDRTTGVSLQAQYILRTINMDTLLKKHNVPIDIDYISVDTEGAELSIVSTFDFKKYNVSCWTVEHNNDHDIGTFLANFFYFQGYQMEKKKWDMFFWK
jgi:FkbM family methyltransferase